ncbi:MAG: acyltransferase family protein [Rhizobiaceae bacterium]
MLTGPGHGDRPEIERPASDFAYRPDIDGLRAIAIIPVVAFHAELAGWGGGYVGVDVFFVVSGFLITSLILAEHADGGFSYWGFLERRARRLVPAAIPVTFFVLLAGWFILLPNQYRELAQSVTAFCLFFANHYFLSESGYFTASEPVPFLHTWSLSVEEQFYFLHALVLMIALRYRPALLPYLLASGLVLSFVLAETLVGSGYPTTAFFIAPSRFWELYAGALIAVWRGAQPGATLPVLMRLAGMALIAYPVFSYDEATAFPGAGALPPVLGAALIVHAGGRATSDLAYRLLAARPVVYVGRISYSLYLWHWPLLAYGASAQQVLPDWWRIGAVAAAFALAAMSYHWIEAPFRQRQLLATRRSLFAGVLSGGAAILLLAFAINVTKGLPERFPPILREAIMPEPVDSTAVDCASLERALSDEFCTIGDSSRSTVDFAVWGDSHAIPYWTAFRDAAETRGLKGVFFSYAGCPPFLNIAWKLDNYDCVGYGAAADRFIREHDVRTIFAIGRWTTYQRRPSDDSEPPYGRPDATRLDEFPEAADENGRYFVERMVAGADRLIADGRRLVIVDPVPEYLSGIRQVYVNHLLWGYPIDGLLQAREAYLERNTLAFGVFDVLDRSENLDRIVLLDTLCPGDMCLLTDEQGHLLYRDGDHLNARGSGRVAPLFEHALDAITTPRQTGD